MHRAGSSRRREAEESAFSCASMVAIDEDNSCWLRLHGAFASGNNK
jgi:hypothetical protein